MDRLEEVLELRVADGLVTKERVMPALLVSAEPRYVETEPWFATRAVEVLQASFGRDGLRLCEACMAPRAFVETGGTMQWQTGPVGLDEVVRLDDQTRGDAQPARSAIWLDENAGGVSIRIVDLATGEVLFAQNVDPNLVENRNTERMYTLAEEYERRHRGDSLTQGFVDLGVYPRQHIALDWTDQWGATNANLTGITLSLFQPAGGLGVVHYRRIPIGNTLLGVKGIVSLPLALAKSQGGDDIDLPGESLVTVVGVVRVPFGRTNYGAIATVSTNGLVSFGLSLLNVHFLPVLP